MSDETELPFTLFIAAAQLMVGLGLVIVGSSSALQIIGGVIVGFALLTAASALYGARRRADVARAPSSPSSQGPRQPPNPDASRSASDGPQEPWG